MAYDVNEFRLIGRVADIKHFDTVSKVRIATQHPKRGNNGKASFNTVSIFTEGTRSYIKQYVAVGDNVGCDGHVATSSYERGGQTVYSVDLIAGRFGLIAKKREAGEDGAGAQ